MPVYINLPVHKKIQETKGCRVARIRLRSYPSNVARIEGDFQDFKTMNLILSVNKYFAIYSEM
jgi:hypothetical protein